MKKNKQPKYRISMERTPGLTEDERRRCLRQVYDEILSWPLERKQREEEESKADGEAEQAEH